MSKGHTQRPDDGKYRDNWDRIFGLDEKTKRAVQKGLDQAKNGELTDGPTLSEETNDTA